MSGGTVDEKDFVFYVEFRKYSNVKVDGKDTFGKTLNYTTVYVNPIIYVVIEIMEEKSTISIITDKLFVIGHDPV